MSGEEIKRSRDDAALGGGCRPRVDALGVRKFGRAHRPNIRVDAPRSANYGSVVDRQLKGCRSTSRLASSVGNGAVSDVGTGVCFRDESLVNDPYPCFEHMRTKSLPVTG